jgi:hypothetical protein
MPVAAQRGGGPTNTRGGQRNPGLQPQLWNLIRAYAPRFGLDPYAVAAVSRVEGGGRFGAVGDHGTSFGPFQLHVGGALPPGWTAADANSAKGVFYAMQHMSTVARGLQGLAAVNAIVRRFERPANPAGEVTSAFAGYRSFGAPLPGGAGIQPNQLGGQQWVNALAQQRQMFQSQQANLLQTLQSQVAAQRQQSLAAGIAAQAQARVQGAQQAQQQVSGAGSLTASASPAAGLYDQKKGILDQIRLQALRRAGIG